MANPSYYIGLSLNKSDEGYLKEAAELALKARKMIVENLRDKPKDPYFSEVIQVCEAQLHCIQSDLEDMCSLKEAKQIKDLIVNTKQEQDNPPPRQPRIDDGII